MDETATPAEEVAWLTGPEGRSAIAEASAIADTESPTAVARFRATYGSRAAAALTQAELRRRARAKFGAEADRWLYTRTGLEQATRPAVAAHRARTFAAAGARRVLDLGCGLGTDSWAFIEAGLDVVAVERDPHTAALAASNLAPAVAAGRARVLEGDATELVDDLWTTGTAVFADPARRTDAGRSWNPADFTPPWEWAVQLLDRAQGDGGVGCLKLGPGLPYRMIPAAAAAEWVSHRGDLMEVALWAGEALGREVLNAAALPAGSRNLLPGTRTATVIEGDGAVHTLLAREVSHPLRTPEPGSVLWEPDPAVIRAGAVDGLAADLGAARLADDIAYLLGDELAPTPFATAFRVLEVLPTHEKVLRAWVRDHEVGRLEIKKRGLAIDPALLRRKLRPAGPHAATLVLSPTPRGARTLIVERELRPTPTMPS